DGQAGDKTKSRPDGGIGAHRPRKLCRKMGRAMGRFLSPPPPVAGASPRISPGQRCSLLHLRAITLTVKSSWLMADGWEGDFSLSLWERCSHTRLVFGQSEGLQESSRWSKTTG